MKKTFLSVAAVLVFTCASGQQTAESDKYPIAAYEELPNPVSCDPTRWNNLPKEAIGWGSTDIRYKKEEPAPDKLLKEITLTAWKGERVSAQFVVSTPKEIENLNYALSPLRKGKKEIPADNLFSGFVRYVMTDGLFESGSGCGYRTDRKTEDSTLVADAIDHLLPSMQLASRTSQAVWVRVQVPSDAEEGEYKGTVTVKNGEATLATLTLKVRVLDRTLPDVSDWSFHLDLWQNPFAVARYYQVDLWSPEHFEAMRPIMELYRNAGGKIVTASIMHKPWNGQTEDYFETMVTWIKKADGTWAFDYTVFDKWVEFMRSIGITKQINCYTMIPWKLSFQYFDQATNSLKFAETAPGEEAYNEMWGAMLTSFAAHLKEKGWFDITSISMDERPMESMVECIKVIRKADKDFKIAFAGNYHEELLDELYDYCIPIASKFPADVKDARLKEGKKTTYYTCCTEGKPNTFTFSPPAEAEWLAWHSAKENLDGYLRWAFNSWVDQPLLDSRFRTWAGGDTYLVYPGARTSIRFERLTEGIQAFEKIRILRSEFEKNNDTRSLEILNRALEPFTEETLGTTPAEKSVNAAKAVINSL